MIVDYFTLTLFDQPIMSKRLELTPGLWFISHLVYGTALLITPFFTQAAIVGTHRGFREAA